MPESDTTSTRSLLLEAAIRVWSDNPAATLDQIAESAGVKRVTLHRLVGTREDLLKEVAIRSIREMDEACERAVEGEQTAIGSLKAVVAALVPVADRCRFLWTHSEVWDESSVEKETARQDKELSNLIDRAKAEGAIAADYPNAWIIASINSIIFTALSTARAGDIAVNDAGSLAVRTLFEGIESESPKRKRK